MSHCHNLTMRRHQNLTGAVNPGNHCFSVGSIASFTFWAYGSGCDLVILGVDLQPIHIIPGHTKGYKLIICLDCSHFSGKVAASYGNEVIIYRPKLVHGGADDIPVFTWIEESVISLSEDMGKATVLSWASTGKKILIGCSEILLWGVEEDNQRKHHAKETRERSLRVHFSIEEPTDEGKIEQDSDPNTSPQATATRWCLLWKSSMKENLRDVQFSPDDELFASISQGESLLKVWHKRTVLATEVAAAAGVSGTSQSNDTQGTIHTSKEECKPPSEIDYTFLYLHHPKPVVGFSWRKSVPLLPSGTIPNVLISSCIDNICRVWCETLTPEADVRKLSTWYPTSHRRMPTKKRGAHERVGKVGANFQKSTSTPILGNDDHVTSAPHNFEKPAKRFFRHFHIAATINPVSDIPLLPSMFPSPDYGADGSLYFTVHWLDNKHHHAMSHLNKILHEALTETTDLEEDVPDTDSDVDSTHSRASTAKTGSPSVTSSPVKRPSSFATKLPVWDSSKVESVDAYLSCFASPVSPEIQSLVGLSLPDSVYELLRQSWLDQTDALFAIHPTDGSLLVWHLSHLDENRCGRIRQTQISFSSRIPMAIPASDASTLSSRMVLFANHYSAHLSFSEEAVMSQPQQSNDNGSQECESIVNEAQAIPSINLISKHSDGSLNQWEILFSSSAGYSAISSITHRSRFCGHRYHMTGIFCHPTLPLLVTTSHHHHQTESDGENEENVGSELILWRIDPVGALCHTGGIGELARMSGSRKDDFKKVAWIPTLFPSWCLGSSSTSPSTCLISLHGSSLNIYQVVVDATRLLSTIPEDGRHSSMTKLGRVASKQSSRHPGCLLLLESLLLEEGCQSSDILLLGVFNEDQLDSKEVASQNGARKGHDICQTYFIVMVKRRKTEASTDIVAKTWKVSFNCSLESVVGVKSSRNCAFGVSDSSDDESDSDYTPGNAKDQEPGRLSYLDLSTCLISSQVLPHPEEAKIVTACSASDPLSSSTFPHSPTAPFRVLTVDEGGHVYFWTVMRSNQRQNAIVWVSCNEFDQVGKEVDNTVAEPQIVFTGQPLVVKMAHSCMLACLTVVNSRGKSQCFVSVYECLSSGGSFWHLQDRFFAGKVESGCSESLHLDWLSREDGTFLLTVNVGRKIKIYTRSPVDLKPDDQVVGTFVNASVGDDIGPIIRPMLKRQSTLDVVTRQKLLGTRKSSSKSIETEHGKPKELFPGADHLLSWSLLSEISLGNSTGLSATHHDSLVTQNPCPVMVSWVVNGLLLVATETEMHVFCHWIGLEQAEKPAPKSAGILYGSASLSQSAPEGLCQHVMKEGMSQGTTAIADVSVVSLMSVADMLCPSLPQYHPLVLSELMNGGRLGTVKHILINLSRMVNGQLESKDELIHTEPLKLKKFGLALEEESGPLEQKSCITPLLLCDMLNDEGQVNKLSHDSSTKSCRPVASENNKDIVNKRDDYEDLFSTSLPEDVQAGLELDLDYQHAAESPNSIDLTVFEPGYLGPEHCQVLHGYLSRNLLPGLSSLDQMELMAIADTLANAVDTVGSNSSEEQSGLGADEAGRGYATSGNTGTESMDNCGLRFVFAMHNHLCLLRSLPATQRTKLLKQGLDSCHFAWAFHSDAEEEMLSLIASVKRGAPEWDELKSFGVGWWIRSNVTLRRLIEQTARAAFQKDNNPLDAAIFYMALNRKNVLKGLFKTVHEDRMTAFFSQDFSEDRWRRAALKNAFALMGKQRFHEAAAFFLLADCVKDAIEVCIDKMQDIQLASVIVRLHDQGKAPRSYTSFLQTYVLGEVTAAAPGDPERKVHVDPFIRSMAYWALGAYEDALVTLLRKDSQQEDAPNSIASITDIFNFYNYLRTHPLIIKQKRINKGENEDQGLDDTISVDERMLYFATATYHLDAGCPLLTLDVLSSLPPLKKEDLDASVFEPSNSEPENNVPASNIGSTAVVAQPTDWAEPMFLGSAPQENEDLELDWSESEESMEENEQVEKEQEGLRPTFTNPIILNKEQPQKSVESAPQPKTLLTDVFASQLRFTACLRIFVSELKSLVTTSSTNGGQIREKLVSWLEKETGVIQKMVLPTASPAKSSASDDRLVKISDDTEFEQRSGFSSDTESDTGDRASMPRKLEAISVPSLHELYMAEKQDWKQRREMVSHRRRWLRQYRGFLRTLLSYCCLHDDKCGSLSPLRMELLLLLQESLQEKTPNQLSSPLPNPTSIPLLSSTIAACRTVVADPTSRLSHMAQDILTCILQLSEPPPYPSWDLAIHASTATICRQAEALSYCIYQSLCDTNSQTYRSRMVDGERRGCSDNHLTTESVTSTAASDTQYIPPSTQPSQWPGVSSLRALLSSDDNHPKLIILLCEALVAVYVSLVAHGLRTCNSFLLYRLVNHQISDKTWRAVFGGGVRVVTRYRPASVGSPSHSMDGKKVRDRLTHKVLSYSHERKGSITSSNSGDTSLYREKFVAPETTLWEYFLSKPLTVSGTEEVGFDSGSDMDESDVYSDGGSDEFDGVKCASDDTEHGNPFSYGWHILRLAVVRTVLQSLTTFIPKTGLDPSELGTFSPVLNSILQRLSQWQLMLTKELENFPEPPANFIAGIKGTGSALRGRPAILKYQAMLDPSNTPFSGVSKESLGARRLWHCLVRHENLQHIFIRYIFHKTGNRNDGASESHSMNAGHPEAKNKSSVQTNIGSRRATIAVMSPGEERPLRQSRSETHKNGMGMIDGQLGKVKILHKETEIISSFCINNAKNGLVVLSTNHDVQELDVSALLASDSWSWLEEDISSSLLQYSEDAPKITRAQKEEDFLVVTRKQSMFGRSSAGTPQTTPWTSTMQTGQGASIVLKRTFSGVRRMTSHPSLPYYLTGHHDGSVRMWEWGHQQQISMFRATGKFPKVTNLHFSPLGNKISAVDTDGYVALWQVSSPRIPFLCHQCHDRSTSDSCFMSSASVIATAGLSSSNCNIAIWDTLMPPRSMLVKDFHAHEGVGGTCLAYAAEHRTLVVGGRDGKVSVYDIRQPDKFLHCFVAHEAPVKCISLSPDERLFVTGSIVGDVRVWDISSRALVYNLSGEHARTSIFRNFGSGTMKVEFASPGNKVFSCGADGTLKLRVLPYESQQDFGTWHSLSGRIQKLTLRRQVVKLASAIKEQTLVY